MLRGGFCWGLGMLHPDGLKPFLGKNGKGRQPEQPHQPASLRREAFGLPVSAESKKENSLLLPQEHRTYLKCNFAGRWFYCRGQRSGGKAPKCTLKPGRLPFNSLLVDSQRNGGKPTRASPFIAGWVQRKEGRKKRLHFGYACQESSIPCRQEARMALGTSQVPGRNVALPPGIPSVPFLSGSHALLPRSSPVCLTEADPSVFTPRA